MAGEAQSEPLRKLIIDWRALSQKSFLRLAQVNSEHEPEWATELETQMNTLRQCAHELEEVMKADPASSGEREGD